MHNHQWDAEFLNFPDNKLLTGHSQDSQVHIISTQTWLVPFQPSTPWSQLQNLCVTMHYLVACDSFRLLQHAFPQSLYPCFLEIIFEPPFPKPSAVLHTMNHFLEKGISGTAKPVFGTRWHLDEPSGAKCWLSRTDLDHSVIKWKSREAVFPTQHRKYGELERKIEHLKFSPTQNYKEKKKAHQNMKILSQNAKAF